MLIDIDETNFSPDRVKREMFNTIMTIDRAIDESGIELVETQERYELFRNEFCIEEQITKTYEEASIVWRYTLTFYYIKPEKIDGAKRSDKFYVSVSFREPGDLEREPMYTKELRSKQWIEMNEIIEDTLLNLGIQPDPLEIALAELDEEEG